ncbi:MAG: hypothetical protein V1884_04170 [Candidatus Omnitrophota bacterium]
MRLSKFLSLVTFATFFCLLYVYQQTEIFRLAYIGQKKLTLFQDCLDKNTALRYNIKKNTSLVRIDDKVYGYTAFEIPQDYRLIKLAYSQESFKQVKQPRSSGQENLLARLFGIKREAQAKTIISPANPDRLGQGR